jgi:hypothetical protein
MFYPLLEVFAYGIVVAYLLFLHHARSMFVDMSAMSLLGSISIGVRWTQLKQHTTDRFIHEIIYAVK